MSCYSNPNTCRFSESDLPDTFQERFWDETTSPPVIGQIKRGICIPKSTQYAAFAFANGTSFTKGNCNIEFNGTLLYDDVYDLIGGWESREALAYLALKYYEQTNCYYVENKGGSNDLYCSGKEDCGTLGGTLRTRYADWEQYKAYERWSREDYKQYLASFGATDVKIPLTVYVTVVTDKAQGFANGTGKVQGLFFYYNCTEVKNAGLTEMKYAFFKNTGSEEKTWSDKVWATGNACSNTLVSGSAPAEWSDPNWTRKSCNIINNNGFLAVGNITFIKKRPFTTINPYGSKIEAAYCYTFLLDLTEQNIDINTCMVPVKSPYCSYDPTLKKAQTECFPVNIDTDKAVSELYKARKKRCGTFHTSGITKEQKEDFYYNMCLLYKNTAITECKCSLADLDSAYIKLNELQLFKSSDKYCYWKYCQQDVPLQFTRPSDIVGCGGQTICFNSVTFGGNFTNTELESINQNVSCVTNDSGGGGSGGGGSGGTQAPDAGKVIVEKASSLWNSVKEFFADGNNTSAVLYFLAATILLIVLIKLLTQRYLYGGGKLPGTTASTTASTTATKAKLESVSK